MSYVANWTFDYNRTPVNQTDLTAQCRSYWQEFKDFLVAAGWSVAQSCDSTQVQSYDTWAALTNIVAATGAHSWITLKSPTGLVKGLDGSGTGDQSCLWLTIAFNYANYYQVYIKEHQAAPTGGTTTASPNSTNQITYSSQQFNRTTLNTNAKFSFVKTDTGHFHTMLSFLGAGFNSFFFGMLPLVNLRVINSTGLIYPYGMVTYAGFTESGTGPLAWSQVGANSNRTKGFAFDGTVGYFTINTLCSASGIMGYDFSSTGGAINGTHPMAPLWVCSAITSKTDVIGEIPDILAGGNPTVQGAVDSTSPTLCRLGNIWLPSNVVITI